MNQIALYLLSVKIINRSQARSVVAAAAYENGKRLYNERDGQTFGYEFKSDILYTNVLLPDTAPPEFSNSEILWNAVERAEDASTRWETAQTARVIIVALPREFTFPVRKELIERYVLNTFVRQGMCADLAIHAGVHSDNPHAHVLLTTREVSPSGFGNKNRDWNTRKALNMWREEWAKALNREFMLRNIDAHVAHKSHKRRGDDEHNPTLHLGPVLSAMERRGIRTLKGDYNRAIEAERKEQKRQKQLEIEMGQSRERGR